MPDAGTGLLIVTVAAPTNPTHVGPDGPVEVARHQLTQPGENRGSTTRFPPVRPARQRGRRARGAQRKRHSAPLGDLRSG